MAEQEPGHRHRPGHHQQRGGHRPGRAAARHPQPHRPEPDPLHRGGHDRRQAAGGPARQAPGHHQPGAHGLRREAAHRPEVQLGPGAGRARESLPLPDACCGEHDDVRVQLGGQGGLAARRSPRRCCASSRLDAEAALRPAGEQGGDHRPRLLQRRPAAGHQGRRAASPAWTCCGSSTSPPPRRWPTASASRSPGRSPSSTSAAARFDVSVLEVAKGVFDVVATGGDTYLGGEDFDNRIIEWLVMNFAKEHGVDLRKERMALQRLKDAAERAKIELSELNETQHQPAVHLHPARAATSALHLQATLTRERFEELTQDLVRADAWTSSTRCSPRPRSTRDELRGDRPGRRHDPHARGAARQCGATSSATPARACTPRRWWRSAPPSRPMR